MPSFKVSAVIPASPKDIYDAWLDSRQHAKMTGAAKAKASTLVGKPHMAWDGYITGKNLELKPGKRIVQSWRSTQFMPEDPDSKIEITLEKAKTGTKVTLHHSEVPKGHDTYKEGWKTHYFVPMKKYFRDRYK